MEKKNGGLITIIIILIIALFGACIYIAYDKGLIFNNNIENKNEENNNEKNEELSDEKEQTKFSAYNIGDEVNLLDLSKWNVLESSLENDEFVTLLSIDNINIDWNITFKDAQNYISTTYKAYLEEKLKANSNDIKELRLLTLEDISKLSGISVDNLIAGTSLENNITPAFLFQSKTITSAIEYDCPIMICDAVPEYYETNPGRICVGTQTTVFEIRPVITISKKYIK